MSILVETKEVAGVHEDTDDFDTQLLMLINAEFSTLAMLGVSIPTSFRVTTDTDWPEYEDSLLSLIQSYVIMKVSFIFNPPTAGAVNNAIQAYLGEMLGRIQLEADVEV
jgi:hypothetical protein